MTEKKIHFGWLAPNGYGPLGWDSPDATHGFDWRQADTYQLMANICENGKFDYTLFADQPEVPAADGDIDPYVKHGVQVSMDSSVLVGYVAEATKHIGLATTVSTGLMPPYILARQMTSLDLLTRGRVAWNVVAAPSITGYPDLAAGEQRSGEDTNYDYVDEYLELVNQLWDSWEPGAIVMDKKQHIFALPEKVRPINFEGEHFYCRGPLAAVPGPQRRPPIIQECDTDHDMEFACRWVDAVTASRSSIPAMKEFCEDIRTRTAKYDRDPGELKIFFNIRPIIADTLEEAQERAAQEKAAQGYLAAESGLGSLAQASPITGTAESVADQLEEIFTTVGCDGFNVTADSYNHSYMLGFVNGVIPILQSRGLARTEYTGATLRDHLAEN